MKLCLSSSGAPNWVLGAECSWAPASLSFLAELGCSSSHPSARIPEVPNVCQPRGWVQGLGESKHHKRICIKGRWPWPCGVRARGDRGWWSEEACPDSTGGEERVLSVPPRRVVQAKEMACLCLCGGCMGGIRQGVGHELRGGVAEGQGLQAFVPQVRISEFLLSGVGAPFRARSRLRSKRPHLPLAGELLGFSEKVVRGVGLGPCGLWWIWGLGSVALLAVGLVSWWLLF